MVLVCLVSVNIGLHVSEKGNEAIFRCYVLVNIGSHTIFSYLEGTKI